MAHVYVCPWWFAYTFDHPLRRWLLNPERELAPFVGEGGRALDIGCGLGFHSIALSRLVGPGGEVVLLDLQQQMIDRAVRRCLRQKDHATITPFVASADEMPVEGEFDFVLMYWMLHEVTRAEALWNRVAEVLAPHGKVYVAEPAFHVSADAFVQSLELARQAGLHVEHVRGAFFNRIALATRPG